MTYYKLRKDTPTAKAGTKFKAEVRGRDNRGLLARLVPLDTSVGLQWKIRDIDNFDEWFEEIQEPTDSIRWKPEVDDSFWVVHSDGDIIQRYWDDCSTDLAHYEMGRIYRTEEEAKKARDRELAEVRLRRTSTFEPDFENGNGGWAVFYNYLYRKLYSMSACRTNAGEPARYATEKDAEKSIKENREDWLIYFGVENG